MLQPAFFEKFSLVQVLNNHSNVKTNQEEKMLLEEAAKRKNKKTKRLEEGESQNQIARGS
jgi:cell division protein ZapA (FtsZ GTPase activity inhibitor)